MSATYKKLLTDIVTASPVEYAARQLLPDWVTVFMLHRLEVPEVGVRGLNPNYLENCLEYLQENGYSFISLEDAIRKSLDNTLEKKKWVAFSLDDGFFEQVELGSKIFGKFDCPSTCFLLTGFIDGQLWQWEHQLIYVLENTNADTLNIAIAGKPYEFNLKLKHAYRPIIRTIRKEAASQSYDIARAISHALQVEIPNSPPLAESPASWDSIRSAEKIGMRFAPHTVTHRIVSGLSDTEQQHEVTESFHRLRQECANPANIFCYPSGRYDQFDDRIVDKLRAANVLGAYLAEPGHLSGRKIRANAQFRYAVPRMTIPDNFTELKLYLSWAQFVRESISAGNAGYTE